jgi:PAS domain S-box-containing protein
MLKLGAKEYLIKDRQFLEILPVAIQKTLDQIETERQLTHAHTELRRLASAVHQSADSIVITNPDGAIEYVNPAFERITGYTKDEAMGCNPRILKSGKQDQMIYESLWQTILSGQVWVGRMVNKRKDGTVYHEDCSISPVLNGDGKIIHYVAVKKDVTKEVELEKQLLHSQKMEAVGLLAGGVAHDLNNLLTPILGYSEMLIMDENLQERHYRDLKEITKAGHKAKDLVRRLMAFGRKQVLEVKPLDLNKILTGFERLLRRALHEDIHLNIVAAPLTKLIYADWGQIEQVVMNLAINAQDAMPQGGTLTIETTEVELDEYAALHRGNLPPGSYVQLTVSDTGCGIDKETQDRIFEPFFTTKDLGKGSGLGLATVYGIITQHGGSIQVESELGLGATFRILLPAWDEANPPTDLVDLNPQMVKGIGTILVAEDDLSVQMMTCLMLKKLGYQSISVKSAEECLQIVRNPDLHINMLLTDVVMPQMNGKELYLHVRQVLPEIKVLFMSGHTANVITERGILEEGLQFIQKPFTISSLSQKIRDVLGIQE